MDLPYLTEDLVRLVLLKLPSVRSVFRLSCVCKSWRDFIKDHYLRIDNEVCRSKVNVLFSNNNDDPFLVFYKHDSNGYYHMRTSARISQNFGQVSFPFYVDRMVGSCNGLLCLRYRPRDNNHDMCFLLYNPITREYRTLPSSNSTTHRFLYNDEGFGLGFDASSNDYKVISIHARNGAQIYKLSTNCWTSLSNVHVRLSESYDRMSTDCVYVNGFCYWRIISRNMRNKRRYYKGLEAYAPGRILALDLKTETFDHISFPAWNRNAYSCKDLGVLDNSLALCRGHGPEGWMKTFSTEVWILSERDNMGKYSWIKKFSILSVDIVSDGGACWVLGSNQAFLLNTHGGKVMTLRTKEEEGKGHNIARNRLFRFDCISGRVMVLKPSLVSLGSGSFMPLSEQVQQSLLTFC